jgi:Xaa-Pro aminopeptidase
VTRAGRVVARFPEKEIDLLLVTDLTNVRYLTGFTGTNGMAVIGPELRRFVTDFRYVEQAGHEVEGFEVERGPQDFMTALAEGWPPGELRLGFDDGHVTVRAHRRLREWATRSVRGKFKREHRGGSHEPGDQTPRHGGAGRPFRDPFGRCAAGLSQGVQHGRR